MRWLLFTLVLIGCPVNKDSGVPYDSTSTGDSVDSMDTNDSQTTGVDGDSDGYNADEDCDDTNPDIHPGATEVCNDVDDNCDGGKDEGVLGTYYIDGDADTYGDSSVVAFGCEVPAGYASEYGDCNDSDATIYPGAPETCTDVKDLNCDGTAGNADQDQDGSLGCNDCDDQDPQVHPGAVEVCDENDVDEDCNGSADDADGGVTGTSTYYEDKDGDTYGGVELQRCDLGTGVVEISGDCDDNDAAINPLAAEDTTDGKDNNCNGLTDEGPGAFYYTDADGDGYGDPTTAVYAANQPPNTVADGTDCDDKDATVNPGASEIADGRDNNCNGLIDDGLPQTWYYDTDFDNYGDPNNSIVAAVQPVGTVADNTDCDDKNPSVNPGATEYLDNFDNNCDGQVDEGFGGTWYTDADGDGFGDPNSFTTSPNQPPGTTADNTDCDDSNANANPNATEVADGVDNNCDGKIDEGLGSSTWYADVDGDTYGDAAVSVSASAQPPGYVADKSDCDDSDTSVNPGAAEIYDGLDNNCDGKIDEGFVATTWYQDADADGYGNASVSQSALSQPSGYVADKTDCNDNDKGISPKATEIYDSVDNNCDGQIDEGFTATTWYQDLDGDSYGNVSVSQSSVTQPSGYVADKTDCNDNDKAVNPKASEVYDSVDNNCNGQVDEGFVATTWYQDLDGDSYGNSSVSQTAISQPSGYVADKTDCNDNDKAINPGASEVADGLDNNCDGKADEGLPATSWYDDLDADGYGDPNTAVSSVLAPSGMIADGTDCDDTNASINPSITEISNGLDDNCDGQVDEGFGTAWYVDLDKDGHGDPDATVVYAVNQPSGYSPYNDDCDDTNAAIYTGGPELPDGVDNDCNGNIDEGSAGTNWPLDNDGDGYGDPVHYWTASQQPKSGTATNSDDCDDTNAKVNPGAAEVTDSLDNDCDGNIDEGSSGTTYYRDSDSDTYGDPNHTWTATAQPSGYVTNKTDCNDTDATINPVAFDATDGIDNDCDGLIDEGSSITWYEDQDGDGYGNSGKTQLSANQPVGYVADKTDCEDLNGNINPGAKEVCDFNDNDCDGLRDEEDPSLDTSNASALYTDADGDGFGDAKTFKYYCTPKGSGYVTNGIDCDDKDAKINPGAAEVVGNGKDDNCDGNAQ